jgi:hypothetical protein
LLAAYGGVEAHARTEQHETTLQAKTGRMPHDSAPTHLYKVRRRARSARCLDGSGQYRARDDKDRWPAPRDGASNIGTQ